MERRYLRAIESGNTHAFYNSWTWYKKRLGILKRDNHECQRCKKEGLVSRGDIVHHIKELKDRPDLGVTSDNLVTVCHRCHNIIHERFEGEDTLPRIDIPERW